jgi:zinc transport system ATP-binding protein
MSVPVLHFDNVCFSYDREEVLHNVSLQVEAGSLVAMVGPNGGGKSTLLKLGLGLLSPTRGSVRLFGRNPRQVRERVGDVPPSLQFDLAFPVNVLDVVLMGRCERHLFGPYCKDDRQAARDALDKVQLADFSARSFSGLSGGERQRVLIAQALVTSPDVMFLDEPTANVDTAVEHEIYELLHELNRRMTILVVSHNLSVVTRYASHVACVNRTASLLPMSGVSEHTLHAVIRGDHAVLRHEPQCHVLDPAEVMRQPHRGKPAGGDV